MKKSGRRTKMILDIITRDLGPSKPHRKIDNEKGVFMPLVIEWVMDAMVGNQLCSVFSLAHYGKQHGDLMRDPEMEVIKDEKGNYYPISYRNDYMGFNQVSVIWERPVGGPARIDKYSRPVQAQQVIFLEDWMKCANKQQQILEGG